MVCFAPDADIPQCCCPAVVFVFFLLLYKAFIGVGIPFSGKFRRTLTALATSDIEVPSASNTFPFRFQIFAAICKPPVTGLSELGSTASCGVNLLASRLDSERGGGSLLDELSDQ